MIESPVLDLSARLLANENINVVRSNARTASFDLESRTLTLPQWKDITPEVDQMLVAHEVSHALFTPLTYSETVLNDDRLQFKHAADYVNIVEDARIERLMKNHYPGIRKTFYVGYEQLIAQDFFGVKDRDLGDLSLIDRINLYYKAGFNCGVSFEEAEMDFVRRIDQLQTFEQVVVIAREIYDFDVNQHRESSRKESSENTRFDPDTNPEQDPDTNPEQDPEQDPELDPETDPDVITYRALREHLDARADTKTINRYYTLGVMKYDPVIPYQNLLSRFRLKTIKEPAFAAAKKFKELTQNNVDYLVKEFEMKKAARAYRRTQTSKSGSLNSNRLWSYKLNDDVFKRIQVAHKEGNHGMVFLLDWSGSMARVIEDTLDQVINLAMFCRRSGIKYRVYTFATHNVSDVLPPSERQNYSQYLTRQLTASPPTEIDPTRGDFVMKELFSDRMSLSEFTDMVAYIQGNQIFQDFRLHGTPLNHALIHMYNTLGGFKRDSGVEKLSFITLTDGEGSKIAELTDRFYASTNDFIRDVHTKNTYPVNSLPCSATKVLLQMIKERHGCTTLGFYIMPPNDAYNVIRDHYGGISKAPSNIRDIMRSQIREQGYASLPDTGRDEMFVLPASRVQISYEPLMIREDASARSIANSLNKFFKKQMTSRFLLDKFIAHIA